MGTLHGLRNQPFLTDLFTFDGTITSGGTAQLLLPAQPWRTCLLIQNISAGLLTLGVGPATATATVTSGAIASVAVNNGGVGYATAPKVVFLGGVVTGDLTTSPSKPAVAVAALSGTAVNTVTVMDGGSGYLVAPYVFLTNPMPDLGGGAFLPSSTAGIQLQPGGSFVMENSVQATSAVAIWGATTGQAFVCKTAGW